MCSQYRGQSENLDANGDLSRAKHPRHSDRNSLPSTHHAAGLRAGATGRSFSCDNSRPTDKLDDYIPIRMEKEHIPGLSLAFVRGRKLIKAKACGHANLEFKANATPDTVYQV